MSEKTELIQLAIDELERVLLGNKGSEVEKVYLSNAIRFIQIALTKETLRKD